MIFKIFIIISLLAVSIYSDSVENTAEPTIDCDFFFQESRDTALINFIIKNDLKNDYENRNENLESCFHFLGKFFLIIDQYRYRNENGKIQQEDQHENKRAFKNKFSLNMI